MKPATLYLGLCVLGTALPLSPLIAFVRAHGPNVPLLFQRAFGDPAGAFFAMDVVVSSLALWVLALVEARRLGMRHVWAPIVANLLVGVSLGLPLFLYMRERRLILRP